MSAVALGIALYFIFNRRVYYLLPLVLIFFLPIIATYERAPMATAFLIGGIFLLMTLSYDPAKVLTLLAVVLVTGFLAISWSGVRVSDRLTILLKGDVRPTYFTSYWSSWESRVGSYMRSIDVMLCEPLGVGFVNAKDFMSSTEIPTNFSFSQQWMTADRFYTQISSGLWDTTAHNYFLDFGLNFGLFGMAALSLIFYKFVANFRRFYQLVRWDKSKDYNRTLFYNASFAIFAGFVFHGLFSNYVLYTIVFFFAFVIFLYDNKQFYNNDGHKRNSKIISDDIGVLTNNN